MHRKFLMATDWTASVFVILTLTNICNYCTEYWQQGLGGPYAQLGFALRIHVHTPIERQKVNFIFSDPVIPAPAPTQSTCRGMTESLQHDYWLRWPHHTHAQIHRKHLSATDPSLPTAPCPWPCRCCLYRLCLPCPRLTPPSTQPSAFLGLPHRPYVDPD
jgi:hypothetical protein